MELNDRQLVQNFLTGDELAFEELLKKYLKPVYNFLYQLTHDKSVSDDLAQETFFKTWRNIKKFNTEKNFKTWLFAIAKNSAFDYLKKKKTIPFSNFLDEEGNSALDNLSDKEILPDELLAKAESVEIIKEKLNDLPEYYRLILLLHYKEDFSLQEISKILGKPYNTIKSQHQRVLKRLAKLLQ